MFKNMFCPENSLPTPRLILLFFSACTVHWGFAKDDRILLALFSCIQTP